MQLIDGKPVYSATDLVGYLACEALTALDRAVLHGLAPKPFQYDADLEVLARRGEEHERRYLAALEREGRHVVKIDPDGYAEDHIGRLRAAAVATREAMASGADVIYQATFFAETDESASSTWRGHADFLLKTSGRSSLGDWHYEVADTKLARHVKAGALLQICSYVDQLQAIQNRMPDRMHVVLGGQAQQQESFPVADFMAYYRTAKRRFERTVDDSALPIYPLPRAPEPVEHCEVCRWRQACDRQRHSEDHLSLVAGIGGSQRRALTNIGITTLAQLGRLAMPPDPPIPGTSKEALGRSQAQASIQLRGREQNAMLHERLDPIEANKGLAGLPEPSAGDLFLDLEGDPYAFDTGLDYLFGVLEPGLPDKQGDPAYHALWSWNTDGEFTLAAEKIAFEKIIDLIMDRLAVDPNLHVYHFAPYEPTAFKRLMGRYATREDEVDRLLRGGILVDLHRVMRQGVRASVESYSIKKLEPLYGFRREVELKDATSSIVEFENWLQLGEGDRPAATHLTNIELYNRDDVVSTWQLREWLEARRAAWIAEGVELPRPRPGEPDPSPELRDHLQRVAAAVERLEAGIPIDPNERTSAEHARWLLAQLLGWHRREEKSAWWRYFYLCEQLTDEERVDEREPIGLLDFIDVVDEVKQSLVYRYRFPRQEHAIAVGTQVDDPATKKGAGTVVAVDDDACTIDLRRGKRNEAPHPRSLVPNT
ncbi:MAG TPA: TM0106 family RecB-like putative nuclease, partial [Chloroflexota bacterium]